jgi:hypothetical protein
LSEVKSSVRELNPHAEICSFQEAATFLSGAAIPRSSRIGGSSNFNHSSSHWSSCSVPLPERMSFRAFEGVLDALPSGIQRVKACTTFDNDKSPSFVEVSPSGERTVRPFSGPMVSGPILLTIGPGSDPSEISKLVRSNLDCFKRADVAQESAEL